MDYEYRILLAEKELAHLKEMQKFLGQHQDTTDLRLTKIQEMLHHATAAIASLAEQTITTRADLQTLGGHVDALGGHVDALGGHVDALAGRVDVLVKALLREHPNGRSDS